MAPWEIRSEVSKQLRETLLKMMSSEWDLALRGQPEKVVTEAARELLRVQSARLQLDNADLAAIRSELIKNEPDLERGRQRLTNVLADLSKTKAVITAVSGFLDVVSRVVSIV